MDKLKKLMAACKCGVYVTVNEHRDYYQSAEDALVEAESHECPPTIDKSVRDDMVALNTIVQVQFYPHTPVGCYVVWHHDLDAALTEALSCLGEA